MHLNMSGNYKILLPPRRSGNKNQSWGSPCGVTEQSLTSRAHPSLPPGADNEEAPGQPQPLALCTCPRTIQGWVEMGSHLSQVHSQAEHWGARGQTSCSITAGTDESRGLTLGPGSTMVAQLRLPLSQLLITSTTLYKKLLWLMVGSRDLVLV